VFVYDRRRAVQLLETGWKLVREIFVVAPADYASGGPELCHQLVHSLNREQRRARIIYFPFGSNQKCPPEFQRYNITTATPEDVRPGSIVVLPEVFAQLLKYFPTGRIYFWWMSVDTFFKAASYSLLGRHITSRVVAGVQLRKLRQRVDQHLYQSEYAREFLEASGLHPSARVSDYLADEYIQAASSPRHLSRSNLVVYNPSKGLDRSKLIIGELERSSFPMPEIVPLAGMNRDEVADLLARAKIYIDFGEHPGKDRIPREAVAFGTCVLVNRRGSAANFVDVPVPETFKINDRVPGFERAAAETIRTTIESFDQSAALFDEYRRRVAQEKTVFLEDIQTVFPTDL